MHSPGSEEATSSFLVASSNEGWIETIQEIVKGAYCVRYSLPTFVAGAAERIGSIVIRGSVVASRVRVSRHSDE